MLDAGVALATTLAIGLAVLGSIPVAVGWILTLIVLVPYVGILITPPARIERLALPKPFVTFLLQASRESATEGTEFEDEIEMVAPTSLDRRWRPVLLVLPALVLIVLGSFVLVQSAITLGERWHVASLLVGVVALAAATSLPPMSMPRCVWRSMGTERQL